MIKECIEVLDNLRPEEVRFDFDPLNRNLCFGGGAGSSNSNWGIPVSIGGTSLDPSTSHSIWNASNWDPRSWGGGDGEGDGGGGDTTESGGLSEEDLAMKRRMYSELTGLMDKKYNPYTGDTQTNRSPEEMALLNKLKGGGGYSSLYDTARTDLGFTSNAFKNAAGYGVGDLDRDAGKLMGAGSTYRDQVANTTMRQMNEAATNQGMINRGHQIGGGAAWGDRSVLQDSTNNQNFLNATGDVLGKMNMSAYNNALDRTSGLNTTKLNAAGRYGDTVMQDLGLGTGSLDKTYGTQFGAFGKDRAYQDRDLATAKKDWDAKENFDWKKLGFGAGVFSGMPFDEKVVTNEPASGGK
jgi:hypothetical protein